MTGFGTMVNAAAILLGSTVGLLLKGGLPKRLQDIITSAVGLCVIFVGASGALAGLLAVSGDGLETRDTMMMIFSMAAGAALGEWMDIERRLEGLGAWCRTRIPAGHAGAGFVDAFVTSSLLFCVGAMAIVGSLEDGLSHNYSTLFAKSVMDGIMAAVFAAAMGIGTMFSVIPVVIYQGSITLLVQTVGDIEDSMDFEAMLETEARHKKQFYKLAEELRKRAVNESVTGNGNV